MFTFLGFPSTEVQAIVEGCREYDLKRQTTEEKSWNQHVTTGKFEKKDLRKVMETYTDPAFVEARRILGYPRPKEEEGETQDDKKHKESQHQNR